MATIDDVARKRAQLDALRATAGIPAPGTPLGRDDLVRQLQAAKTAISNGSTPGEILGGAGETAYIDSLIARLPDGSTPDTDLLTEANTYLTRFNERRAIAVRLENERDSRRGYPNDLAYMDQLQAALNNRNDANSVANADSYLTELLTRRRLVSQLARLTVDGNNNDPVVQDRLRELMHALQNRLPNAIQDTQAYMQTRPDLDSPPPRQTSGSADTGADTGDTPTIGQSVGRLLGMGFNAVAPDALRENGQFGEAGTHIGNIFSQAAGGIGAWFSKMWDPNDDYGGKHGRTFLSIGIGLGAMAIGTRLFRSLINKIPILNWPFIGGILTFTLSLAAGLLAWKLSEPDELQSPNTGNSLVQTTPGSNNGAGYTPHRSNLTGQESAMNFETNELIMLPPMGETMRTSDHSNGLVASTYTDPARRAALETFQAQFDVAPEHGDLAYAQASLIDRSGAIQNLGEFTPRANMLSGGSLLNGGGGNGRHLPFNHPSFEAFNHDIGLESVAHSTIETNVAYAGRRGGRGLGIAQPAPFMGHDGPGGMA